MTMTDTIQESPETGTNGQGRQTTATTGRYSVGHGFKSRPPYGLLASPARGDAEASVYPAESTRRGERIEPARRPLFRALLAQAKRTVHQLRLGGLRGRFAQQRLQLQLVPGRGPAELAATSGRLHAGGAPLPARLEREDAPLEVGQGSGRHAKSVYRTTDILAAVGLVVGFVLALSLVPAPMHARLSGIGQFDLVKAPAHEFKLMRPVLFAAIGDSITAQDYQGSKYVWQSWVPAACTAGRTEFVAGGYAVPGRTTVDMLAGAVPLDVDVLVFQGAVNDVNLGYDHGGILDRISRIVAVVGAPHVLVSALPPNDRYPAAALQFNLELAAYSASQGWSFVDPWATWRTPTGTYVPGAAWDDLHPVADTAAAAGVTLGNALWAVANKQKVLVP